MSFFEVPFRDKKFFITAVGSSTPDYVYQSYFQLEKEMRELWWDVKEGDVVIDVGAAYGSYALPALALGASRVLFFEPSKTEFFDICSNVMINGWMDRCLPFNCLVGDGNDIWKDYYPDSHSYRPEGRSEERFILSLDRIMEAYAIARCDWIKVDTEGAEPEVLAGGLTTIQKCRPRILVENHVGFRPNVDVLVKEYLEDLHYQITKEHKGIGINDYWQLWEYLGK